MINRKLLGLSAALMLAATAAGMGGCASGARATQMVTSAADVTPVVAGQPGYKAFRLGTVSGGGKTNPLWTSNVAPDQFSTALESSLKGAGHLADSADAASYEITAQLTKLDQPMVGLDMSVTSTVQYKAAPVAGGPSLFDKAVAATGTAKFGEALVGVERLRLANEAAVRENIEAFITRLRTALGDAPAGSMPIS